jgi:hypothetical protein
VAVSVDLPTSTALPGVQRLRPVCDRSLIIIAGAVFVFTVTRRK